MYIETMGNFLYWCAAFSYLILAVWFALFSLAHERIYQLHGRWYRLSLEQFDALNYALMGVFKIGVLLLFVVPYIALRMIV